MKSEDSNIFFCLHRKCTKTKSFGVSFECLFVRIEDDQWLCQVRNDNLHFVLYQILGSAAPGFYGDDTGACQEFFRHLRCLRVSE